MATQTVVAPSFPSLSNPQIGLYNAATGALVEAEGAASVLGDGSAALYSRAFTDVAAGRYMIVVFDGSAEMSRDFVTVEDATDTYLAESLTKQATVADIADVAGGLGPHTITVTCTTGAVGVPNVVVSIVGSTRKATTGANGVAILNVEAGTYNIKYTPPATYDSLPDDSVIINADTAISKVLTTNTIAPASDPSRCNVAFNFIKADGTAADNITLKIRLKNRDSVASQIVSNETLEVSVGATGQTTVELIRSNQFTSGTGEYEVEAYYENSNRPVFKTVSTIPDVASYDFATIIVG